MSAPTIEIRIDGQPHQVPFGTTVAAALFAVGHPRFRSSVSGAPRAALCGIGTCYECRVWINGHAGCLACQTLARPAMDIRTDA